MTTLTESEEKARKRVCLALDVSSVDQAFSLARNLGDLVGSFKVGKELHTAAGNEEANIVDGIHGPDLRADPNVFLDLKYHDTPGTVKAAARQADVPGVYMFNVHVAGGEAMCRAAVEGAQARGGETRPLVIGVTVLTSLDDKDLEEQRLGISFNDLVHRRTELARNWGLDGIVCPAKNAGELEREFGSDFLYVTPGVKWKGQQGVGQKQLYTPDRALQDCSNSILVIGSGITKFNNQPASPEQMRESAYGILQAMAPHV